jgi:DNA polymerase III subunit delta'
MQFSQVIGHSAIKERLISAFHEGRIAHALMFLGPEGSGNLPLALAFAQYISCPNKTGSDSCGACPTCKKISHLQFADLFFTFPFFNKTGKDRTTCDDWLTEWRAHLTANIYTDLDQWRNKITEENKQLNISVYEAANIVNRLSLKSYEGGYKFQIIWMADFLKPDTANKLLKIVEEPPDKTLFFFVANSLENILPTILSRVQMLYVPAVHDADVRMALEKMNLSTEHSSSIAHFAHGNWTKALQLTQAENPDEVYSNEFQEWMRKCFKKETVWLFNWANRMHDKSREDQKHFLTYALDQIRQNLMLNYTGGDLVRMNDQEMAFSSKFAPFINDLNAEGLMEEITEAHNDVSRNAYSKMVFADLSVKIHYLLVRKS